MYGGGSKFRYYLMGLMKEWSIACPKSVPPSRILGSFNIYTYFLSLKKICMYI